MAKASGVAIHDFGTTFKAYRREVLERIPLYGQMHRVHSGNGQHRSALVAEVPIEDQTTSFG